MKTLIPILFRINKVLAVVAIAATLLTMCKAHADVGDARKFHHMPLKIHKSGVIRVMVIDTGVDFSHPWLRLYLDQNDVTSNLVQYIDNVGHGTHIAGLILYGPIHENGKKASGLCKQVKITSCKYINRPGDIGVLRNEINCLNRASKEGFDAVNYSSSGPDPDDNERKAIESMRTNSILLVTSTGNQHVDLKRYPTYPSGYAFGSDKHKSLDNVVPLGAISGDLSESRYSNYGQIMPYEISDGELSTIPGNHLGKLAGTSQAAAIYLHSLLVEKCKELDNAKVAE